MDSRHYIKVIVNPAAGRGSASKKWKDINKALTMAGLDFTHEFTHSKGHAMEIAREAIREGYDLLVAVGGDGTLNEVANGILHSGMADRVCMGIIDSGTGSGFIHSIGILRDYCEISLHLANPRKARVDVGMARYYNEGQPAKQFFINAASLGFDGQVVKTASKTPKFLRGTTSYLLAALHSWFIYQNKEAHLRIDNIEREIRMCSLLIANGKFLNKWMPVAPEGNLNDGLLEVIVVRDIGKLEQVPTLPSLYRGKDIEHPKVRMYKAREVAVHSPEPLLIQAGGEFLGEGPATFQVLPAALNVVV